MKVKLDFMNATNEIVQENIKNVYQDNNQGIHLLLKNFTNYFTLNYDPFLYLLLLKFKKDENANNDALTVQNTSLFQEEDLNQSKNNIYSEIKKAWENGHIQISINSQIDLKTIKKGSFEAIIKEYSKKENKGWNSKDIKKACDEIWKKNNQPELDVNDGFQKELFQSNDPQNLYFLHGAFQIVKSKNDIKKITAKQNKPFVQKLEETIHSEDKNIVCVLTYQSEEKKAEIEENQYLKKCFDDLSKIDGSLVILGSSLTENDKHIFEQINKSSVNKIYISSCREKSEEDFGRAKMLLTDKEIALFDYKTISYKEVKS